MKYFKVIPILLTSIFLSCNGSKTGENSKSSSTYDRVIETGKLKVGYISYPPSFIKDPNSGEYSGIFHEVLQKIGKKLGVEIEYIEELGWGSMIEAIKMGRVDLVCTGVWPTTERGKHVDFTNPLYYSTVRAYTQFDNTNFDSNLSTIDDENVKISTLDGEMTSTIAELDFPNAQEVSLPQVSDVAQVLLEVANGKADVTFVEPAIALEFIANNPNRIKEVEGVLPVRIFPNTMIVGKGEVELLSTLNIGIDELVNNGFIDKVMSKYEKHDGSFQKSATPFRN